MARALVLMGSGETSPTMVTPHQQILKNVTGKKFILDTPYGFQENADELTEKIRSYFEVNVGIKAEDARLRTQVDRAADIANAIANINSASQGVVGGASQAVEQAMDAFQKAGYEVAFPARRASHEFVVTFRSLREQTGVTAMDVAKRLLDNGMVPAFADSATLNKTIDENRRTYRAVIQAAGIKAE